MNKALVAWIILMVLTSCTRMGNIHLQPEFTIYINDPNSVPVAKALEILQRDIKEVLGQEAKVISDSSFSKDVSNALLIINGENPDCGIEPMEGFERHKVYSLNNNLVLQGSDIRGTIYAIYTFSEKFLGVNPLWYWGCNRPQVKESIRIPHGYSYDSGEPYVKYRTWFPNDTDMFSPWRKDSKLNNEIWLETMLRLKLNTVEINRSSDYSKLFAVTADTRLIDEYGLKITYHHTSALNSPFKHWDEYWTQIRHMPPPELLLSNTPYIEEFWRYNVRSLVENGIDPIWVVNFRGNRDIPFWYTFEDSPESMQDRASVINEMVEKQVKIIIEESGNERPLVRMIFYDELSDLLAEGLLHPPGEAELIWNFVAARRDHFPNKDIRSISIPDSIKLGYYMDFQFTSTGSHFAQAEGPWKMEKNYRFVDSKNNTPFYFSVANAGNLREHLLTLSANAEMLWHFQSYETDQFLRSFCSTCYGDEHAESISRLYKEFFYAYWRQKKNDLEGYERQYIFHDLRYKQTISQLSTKFFDPIDLNPLEDYSWEQMPNRTFRIVPEDNSAENQMEALLRGTKESYDNFRSVARTADSVIRILDPESRIFFNDNLRNSAYFMMYLNESLHNYCQAYLNRSEIEREENLRNSLNAAMNARESIFETAHDQFGTWYSEEWIFDIDDLVSRIDKTLNQHLNNNEHI
ncbi:MAG: hypothetical protein GY790_23510 [Bacteroidetes bacterium]|nr:hypothetical protein [Bacteroidota bacterium]